MPAIVKKTDSSVVIIHPNNEKYGSEYKEITQLFDEVETKIIEEEVIDENNWVEIDGEKVFEKKIISREEKNMVQVERVVKVIRPYSECKGLLKYIDETHPEFVGIVHEWFWKDEQIDKSDLESREQLYHDGTDEVKKDLTWSKVLMPTFLIKQRHIDNISKTLDTELAKDSPDAIVALKLNQQKEAAKKLDIQKDEKEIYQIAIEGLARSEKDTTAIKAKLEDKIAEIEAKSKPVIADETPKKVAKRKVKTENTLV